MVGGPGTIVEPVTPSGRAVRLEPLTLEHVPALSAVGLEPELWRWTPTAVSTAEEMRNYVSIALDERRHGTGRLETGWTWVVSAFQGTAINTEAKLLLLTHAFEVLGMNRVEFKNDNEKSREWPAIKARLANISTSS